jgi:hypothetical protein
MTVRTLSGLDALVGGVRAYLEGHGVSAVVAAGFRERAKQIGQGPGRANRIVFVPGDTTSGRGGRLVPVRGAGPRDIMRGEERVATVRSIADWERALTLSVWAYDGTKAGEEMAQIIACESLFEWAKRAVDAVGLANITWGEIRWTVPKERAFGQELLAALTFRHPIYDVPEEVAYPGLVVHKPETGP